MTAVEAALEFAEDRPEATRTRELVWQDPMPAVAAGARLTGLEYMTALITGALPPPPIAVTMRFAPVEVAEGGAVFEGRPGEEHYNPIGVVHGGYAATLLDTVLGCAVHTTLGAGEAYTTLTLETKYLRPILRDTGVVRAAAEVTHRGRRQASAEAKLTTADGERLLASATSTCMIL